MWRIADALTIAAGSETADPRDIGIAAYRVLVHLVVLAVPAAATALLLRPPHAVTPQSYPVLATVLIVGVVVWVPLGTYGTVLLGA